MKAFFAENPLLVIPLVWVAAVSLVLFVGLMLPGTARSRKMKPALPSSEPASWRQDPHLQAKLKTGRVC